MPTQTPPNVPKTPSAYRTIDYKAILLAIDPKIESDPWVVYDFGGGRILKTERPLEAYSWTKGITP